ncbi:hypothetical protein EJ06DRAFT_529459 [Trichodelitschia bisporula]|uniref:Small ribosomal subunit protein uS5m n=1 Tax=Trichodelitschia bisporula TaxID=703511 RepID=A0A6G1HZ76_9PEZI|nr:hypothetical protein EJ06DRAFT_529459 [Trichodelitschia bisporula]
MSVCRPVARCLLSTSAANPSSAALRIAPHRIRCFATTPRSNDTKRPKQLDPAKSFRPYTEEEKAALKAYYTPEQIAAIEAAEAAIAPRDLEKQTKVRTDPWRVTYPDDFTTIDPLLDFQPKPEVTSAPSLYLKTDEEWYSETAQKLQDPRTTEELFAQVQRSKSLPAHVKENALKLKKHIGTQKETAVRVMLGKLIPNKTTPKVQSEQDHEELAFTKRLGLDPDDPLWLVGGKGKELMLDESASALAPEIPKFDDPRVRWPTSDEDDPAAAAMKQVSLVTGYSLQELRQLKTKILSNHRVVNQTRMGKIQSIYCLSIAGNGKGLLGIGEGKSAEGSEAARMSTMAAIRNMKPIPRYEDRTIYGEVKGKVGAAEVTLSSRPPGFGIRCQHLIYEMCRAAGISDLAARVTRSRNPMNVAKATYEALMSQRLPEDIARARGKKLVDLRKVYYAGHVH